MKRIAQWTLLFIMFALVGFGATLLAARGTQMAQLLTEEPIPIEASSPEMEGAEVGTLSVDAAPDSVADSQSPPGTALSAVGTIEVKDDRQVILEASGRVEEVNVEVGDRVKSDTLMFALDTTQLDWAVEQAEIGFETARINFEELGDLIEESDISVAEAKLLLAEENLAEVEEGPTKEVLAAAEGASAAAWARYEELQEEPTQAQINQALANLKKAEISVQQAQREFDKIAWLPEAAATDAADNLQKATVDFEAAKASFEEASKPATEAELQSAVSGAQSAQDSLNQLLKQPTAAALADAKANVASAEAALDKLEKGPKESELRKAELNVRQAMIGLEQARLAREHADVRAPIDGTVLSVNLELGQQASAGTDAATLADTTNIRLIANVEQKDISNIQAGQSVAVSVFALPDETFVGMVDRVSPTANSGTGFVTFPVIIIMTEGPIEKLLPGMTASAVFLNDTPAEPQAEESGTDSPADAEDAEAEDAEATSAETAEDEASGDAEDSTQDSEQSTGGN